MKASRSLLHLFFVTACGAAHDAAPSASGRDAKPHTDSAAAATPVNTPTTSGNSVRQPAMQDLADTALIEKVYGWAKQRNALLFLDIQVAHSTMQQELPRLLPFLSRPDVHLAMDAEFSMHYSHEGVVPGKRIGQFDAKDVNWVSGQLRQLVIDKKLPPKVLIVHR